ncbi:hypothetical protein [Nesterenkonia marinintestina]|uniref:hypothetical protein n=1 Tax=Nesterenkonia marinintestina TaxID=2979865 RepID=UPI0021C1AF38|nr:hypothetical protein [Nesterenkonia sp. GX14115]
MPPPLGVSPRRSGSCGLDRFEETPSEVSDVPVVGGTRRQTLQLRPDAGLDVDSCPLLGAWSTKRRIGKTMTSAALRLSPPAGRRAEPPRLLFIGAAAVLLMIGWLIFSNILWDTLRRRTFASVVLLYNLSTVLTLLICVAALYFVLVMLILVGGVVVIDFEFMRSVIGDQADWRN